jgi:uncharacterized protein (TIGR03435 family)
MMARAWATVCGVVAALTLSAQERPAFDVVSVKPVTVLRMPAVVASQMLTVRAGRVQAPGMTAADLIARAFPVDGRARRPERIVGGPPWFDVDRFEFTATGNGVSDAALLREFPALLRGVLEDRFALRTHVEMRPMPAYVLTLARRDRALGAQLTRTAPGTGQWSTYGREFVSAYATSIAAFAASMTNLNLAGRPVIDRTGLTGLFDLELYWSPEQTVLSQAAGGSDAPGPSLFTAVQEQLGLKLTPSTERLEVVVVDHIERPTAN